MPKNKDQKVVTVRTLYKSGCGNGWRQLIEPLTKGALAGSSINCEPIAKVRRALLVRGLTFMQPVINERRWRRMWHKSVPIRPWDIPAQPGVYAIYLDNKLIYIGQSKNLFKRICSHDINYRRYSNVVVTPWGEGTSVRCKYSLSLRHGDWAMREIRLIRRLQPIGNKRGNISWEARAA